jgi:protein TonB
MPVPAAPPDRFGLLPPPAPPLPPSAPDTIPAPPEDPRPPAQRAEPAPAVPPPPPPAPPVPRQAPAAVAQAPSPRTVWSPPSRTAQAAEGTPMAAGGAAATGAVVPPRPSVGASNPSPDYPTASRRRGEQGRVTLLVQVEPSGRVRDLAVLGSSGYPALDAEAERTVRRWRFEPGTQDGRPVFSTVTVGITFRLDGERRW